MFEKNSKDSRRETPSADKTANRAYGARKKETIVKQNLRPELENPWKSRRAAGKPSCNI